MSDTHFLANLGTVTIAAAVFALVSLRLRVPSIVAYLVAGLVLGPLTGIVGSGGHGGGDGHGQDDDMHLLSEVGIVLLLFLVGLELTVEKVKSVGRVAVLAGGGQIVVTVLLAFGCCALLGFAPLPAAVLAVGLTLSSTVVVVKLLVERGESGSVSGQAAIGVLLVQDLFVIVLLTVLAGLGDSAGAGAGGPGLDPGAVLAGVGQALLGMAVVVAVLAALARFVLPLPFTWASRSRETVFVWALAWCFLVVLVVHAFGLSAEIGAFLAGVSLAQLPHIHDVQRRVRPLMSFFVAVFFVSLGTRMEFMASVPFWLKAVALSAFVLVGKFGLILFITRRLGFARRDAFDTAVLLSQISEFSFILAAAAAGAGLVGGEVGSLLGVIGLITISVSSLAVAGRDWIFGRLFAGAGAGEGVPARESGSSAGAGAAAGPAGPGAGGDQVIVVGMNTLGRELVRRLHERGERVTAIDTDPGKLIGLPGAGMVGDAGSGAVLEEAGLGQAKLLVSALHIDAANDLLAYRARCAEVRFAVHAANLKELDNLLAMDAAYLMTPKADGLRLQRKKLTKLGLLPGR